MHQAQQVLKQNSFWATIGKGNAHFHFSSTDYKGLPPTIKHTGLKSYEDKVLTLTVSVLFCKPWLERRTVLWRDRSGVSTNFSTFSFNFLTKTFSDPALFSCNFTGHLEGSTFDRALLKNVWPPLNHLLRLSWGWSRPQEVFEHISFCSLLPSFKCNTLLPHCGETPLKWQNRSGTQANYSSLRFTGILRWTLCNFAGSPLMLYKWHGWRSRVFFSPAATLFLLEINCCSPLHVHTQGKYWNHSFLTVCHVFHAQTGRSFCNTSITILFQSPYFFYKISIYLHFDLYRLL